jgi:excisionase family DNA binding protein
MKNEHYMTVKELADHLKVAEATVRQWIRSRELRAIEIGKGWRISQTDFQAFLRLKETAPRPAPLPKTEPDQGA